MLTLLHLLGSRTAGLGHPYCPYRRDARVYARLRTVLRSSVEKKPLAFCAGIGVTALVQSSNATTLLIDIVCRSGSGGAGPCTGYCAGR